MAGARGVAPKVRWCRRHQNGRCLPEARCAGTAPAHIRRHQKIAHTLSCLQGFGTMISHALRVTAARAIARFRRSVFHQGARWVRSASLFMPRRNNLELGCNDRTLRYGWSSSEGVPCLQRSVLVFDLARLLGAARKAVLQRWLLAEAQSLCLRTNRAITYDDDVGHHYSVTAHKKMGCCTKRHITSSTTGRGHTQRGHARRGVCTQSGRISIRHCCSRELACCGRFTACLRAIFWSSRKALAPDSKRDGSASSTVLALVGAERDLTCPRCHLSGAVRDGPTGRGLRTLAFKPVSML